MRNKQLKNRILEISYKNKLSHLSSTLSAVDIISDIYEDKNPDDIFVLSQGQAGLALYVVLEKFEDRNVEHLLEKHGIHPNRDLSYGIHVSSGSLGHGLPIALGMAISDKSRNVFCLISDGECMEGSIYEALRLKEKLEVDNLHVYINYNGYSAYSKIEEHELAARLGQSFKDIFDKDQFIDTSYIYDEFPLLKGYEGHYYTLTNEDIIKYLGEDNNNDNN